MNTRSPRSTSRKSTPTPVAAATTAHSARHTPGAESSEALLQQPLARRVELETQNEALLQAQTALAASHDRYVALFDLAPVGFLTLSEGGLIEEINIRAARMLHAERAKLVGQDFLGIIVASDRRKWQDFFSHALLHVVEQSCEIALGCEGTPTVSVQVDCISTLGHTGVPVLHVALTDITERKQLEEELRQRNHYRRALLDNFPFLVWLKDADGRYLAVNRPFAASCGNSSADALVGKTDFDLWPRELAEAYRLDDDAIRRSGKSRIIEEEAMIGGERIWVETYKSPVTLDGQVIGTVGFATDITERRKVTVSLQASEERLRLAKRAANLGIFDRDVASGRSHWDERARELWGVSPNEAIDFKDFLAGVHPDDRARARAAIERATDPRGSGQYATEYRVVSRADGRVRDIAANGQVFFKDGRAERIIGTVKDITEQKKLEKEVRESRSDMEHLVRQQVASHTAAAIAHELNQPLVSISAYSEAALRMLRGGIKSPEKLVRALEGAMEQAHRAGRTLHELLNFLHKGDVEAQSVNLNELMEEALAIAIEGGYGGFQPELRLQHDLPPVHANPLQVKKVLVNLLHNSVEAMREAGNTANTIELRTTAAGNMAQVTVQDSGPGFKLGSAARIFDPFFTTKQGGIGLGLAISRAIIEAHGGQLWAEPEAGSGATFHFTLPFAA